MRLTSQYIWIISPQEWDHIFISKHNYAFELARKNNRVIFINPPQLSSSNNNDTLVLYSKNLQILTFNFRIPLWMKFKFPFLYNYIVSKRFSKALKQNGMPSVLWNFDNGIFFKFEKLFNSYKIFHPVDAFDTEKLAKHYKNYNIIFSVSEKIVTSIEHNKKFVINHGLNNELAILSKERLSLLKSCTIINDERSYKIGYVGNISIPTLDFECLNNLIAKFPNIQFNFYGPFLTDDLKVVKLKMYKNVEFKGLKYGKELYNSMVESDLLIICYKIGKYYLGDNSHKILDYLSSGKAIVSSNITMYHNNPLIVMNDNKDNSNYIEIFTECLQNIEALNNQNSQIQRIEFALENTYTMQIEKIEHYINQSKN